MAAYYNEFDPQKAAWLRELIKRNLIADGEVDERSIEDVLPADVAGFRQCHWFAGVGIWSYALRNAGWGDDRAVWTASCPCQPFSTAGKGKGIADERHLWPAFYHIASIRKPDVIFGEQVASKDGLAWLDTVQSDMEAMAYAFGPVVVPAAGVGAPHIRHRVFFVADSQSERCGKAWERSRRPSQRFSDSSQSDELADTDGEQLRDQGRREIEPAADCLQGTERQRERIRLHASPGGDVNGVGNSTVNGQSREGNGSEIAAGRSGVFSDLVHSASDRPEDRPQLQREYDGALTGNGRNAGVVDDASQSGLQGHAGNVDNGNRPGRLGALAIGSTSTAGPVNGFWRDAEWVYCRTEPRYPEGSYRAVRPGSFPLVDGAPARVVRLRGYGDGINAEVAKEFIAAYLGLTV